MEFTKEYLEKLSVSEATKLLTGLNEEEIRLFIELSSESNKKGIISLRDKMIKKIRALDAERERIRGMRVFEDKYADMGYIAGIDEVGRGPLAGPVITCAVVLPKGYSRMYINDSKKLTAAKREELSEKIKEEAVAYCICGREPEVIDKDNILNATLMAMRDSVLGLKVRPKILLNDAVIIPDVNIEQEKIIHGDARSISIAAASIVAKVYRDALMCEYDKIYPQYGFAKNAGYGTKEHIEAIKKYGPCPIHRKSFIRSFL